MNQQNKQSDTLWIEGQGIDGIPYDVVIAHLKNEGYVVSKEGFDIFKKIDQLISGIEDNDLPHKSYLLSLKQRIRGDKLGFSMSQVAQLEQVKTEAMDLRQFMLDHSDIFANVGIILDTILKYWNVGYPHYFDQKFSSASIQEAKQAADYIMQKYSPEARSLLSVTAGTSREEYVNIYMGLFVTELIYAGFLCMDNGDLFLSDEAYNRMSPDEQYLYQVICLTYIGYRYSNKKFLEARIFLQSRDKTGRLLVGLSPVGGNTKGLVIDTIPDKMHRTIPFLSLMYTKGRDLRKIYPLFDELLIFAEDIAWMRDGVNGEVFDFTQKIPVGLKNDYLEYLSGKGVDWLHDEILCTGIKKIFGAGFIEKKQQVAELKKEAFLRKQKSSKKPFTKKETPKIASVAEIPKIPTGMFLQLPDVLDKPVFKGNFWKKGTCAEDMVESWQHKKNKLPLWIRTVSGAWKSYQANDALSKVDFEEGQIYEMTFAWEVSGIEEDQLVQFIRPIIGKEKNQSCEVVQGVSRKVNRMLNIPSRKDIVKDMPELSVDTGTEKAIDLASVLEGMEPISQVIKDSVYLIYGLPDGECVFRYSIADGVLSFDGKKMSQNDVIGTHLIELIGNDVQKKAKQVLHEKEQERATQEELALQEELRDINRSVSRLAYLIDIYDASDLSDIHRICELRASRGYMGATIASNGSLYMPLRKILEGVNVDGVKFEFEKYMDASKNPAGIELRIIANRGMKHLFSITSSPEGYVLNISPCNEQLSRSYEQLGKKLLLSAAILVESVRENSKVGVSSGSSKKSNQKSNKTLLSQDDMRSILDGQYQNSYHAIRRLGDTDREELPAIYTRFINGDGVICYGETDDNTYSIRRRRSLSELQITEDHQVVIHDIVVRFGGTIGYDERMYDRIRNDSRLQKYILLRFIATLRNTVFRGKTGFENEMRTYFMQFWKELDIRVQERFLKSFSEDNKGESALSLEVYPGKTCISAWLDFCQDNHIPLVVTKPKMISAEAFLEYMATQKTDS